MQDGAPGQRQPSNVRAFKAYACMLTPHCVAGPSSLMRHQADREEQAGGGALRRAVRLV